MRVMNIEVGTKVIFYYSPYDEYFEGIVVAQTEWKNEKWFTVADWGFESLECRLKDIKETISQNNHKDVNKLIKGLELEIAYV